MVVARVLSPVNSLDLRSPIEQVQRSSYALFRILSNEASNNRMGLDRHHWGVKKIPLKNLLVMINTKPVANFDFVKVVTLRELLGYITYFNPVFTARETRGIKDRILDLMKFRTT